MDFARALHSLTEEKASTESCSFPCDHSCVSYFHQVSPDTGALLCTLWAKERSVLIF